MSLPELILFGSGLALALLWWNRAVWDLRNWGPAVAEGWLPGVEQHRASLQLKAVEHLDRASIVGKVWPPRLHTHLRCSWKKETQVFSKQVKACCSAMLLNKKQQHNPPSLKTYFQGSTDLTALKEKNVKLSLSLWPNYQVIQLSNKLNRVQQKHEVQNMWTLVTSLLYVLFYVVTNTTITLKTNTEGVKSGFSK